MRMLVPLRVRMAMTVRTANVDMIRSSRQPAHQEPKADEDDERSAADAQDTLNSRGSFVWQDELQQKCYRERSTRVCERDNQSEDNRVSRCTLLADQVCGHHRLAVARRYGMQNAVHGCEEHDHPEADVAVEQHGQ